MAKLIILRGNSCSCKTMAAKLLLALYGGDVYAYYYKSKPE